MNALILGNINAQFFPEQRFLEIILHFITITPNRPLILDVRRSFLLMSCHKTLFRHYIDHALNVSISYHIFYNLFV